MNNPITISDPQVALASALSREQDRRAKLVDDHFGLVAEIASTTRLINDLVCGVGLRDPQKNADTDLLSSTADVLDLIDQGGKEGKVGPEVLDIARKLRSDLDRAVKALNIPDAEEAEKEVRLGIILSEARSLRATLKKVEENFHGAKFRVEQQGEITREATGVNMTRSLALPPKYFVLKNEKGLGARAREIIGSLLSGKDISAGELQKFGIKTVGRVENDNVWHAISDRDVGGQTIDPNDGPEWLRIIAENITQRLNNKHATWNPLKWSNSAAISGCLKSLSTLITNTDIIKLARYEDELCKAYEEFIAAKREAKSKATNIYLAMPHENAYEPSHFLHKMWNELYEWVREFDR